MVQKKFLLLFCMGILAVSYTFMGGDCSTNNNENIMPPDSNTFDPPASFTFKVEAEAGGDARVTFNWTSSPDGNRTDFRGYRIITTEVDSNGHLTSVLQETSRIKSLTYSIDHLERGRRYKTYLCAELEDGTKSDSLETEVYAAVFYNNGIIHSYNANGNSLSGYGWNIVTGNGSQYFYNQTNSEFIDIHLREESTGLLFLKSPDFLDEFSGTNYRFTQMSFIGFGQKAFDDTNLNEPSRTEVLISEEGVYLLKTEDENYVKLWIISIEQTGNPSYFNVKFEYKFQPIKGLRAL